MEAEKAEVGITEVLELVDEAVLSLIRKMELTSAIQLVGMNKMN